MVSEGTSFWLDAGRQGKLLVEHSITLVDGSLFWRLRAVFGSIFPL